MTTLDESPPPPQPRGLLARLRWPLMIGGPLLILAIVAFFVLTGGKTESTDDAYVQVDKAAISAQIAGRVTEVDVGDNQTVRKGQILFKIDPQDQEAALARAQGDLAAARLQVTTLRQSVSQQQVLLGSAEKTAAYQAHESTRQQALVAAGSSSRQQAAEQAHNAQVASDQVTLDKENLATAVANLGGAGKNTDAYPTVQQALAAVRQAQINLGYTTVAAPADGIVTRVEQLQPGTAITASQTQFYLLSGEPWIEANFKENQLRKMRVGQRATIQIDALGGKKFDGYVQSFAPGAGQAFSALPAQNATGNWVKVVQRLPVRIAFRHPPPEVAGRAGLSAKVTVDVAGGAR